MSTATPSLLSSSFAQNIFFYPLLPLTVWVSSALRWVSCRLFLFFNPVCHSIFWLKYSVHWHLIIDRHVFVILSLVFHLILFPLCSFSFCGCMISFYFILASSSFWFLWFYLFFGFFCLFVFPFFFFASPWHMEFHREKSDPSCSCNLCCNNAGSYNPMCWVGDWTCVVAQQRCCWSHCSTEGTPLLFVFHLWLPCFSSMLTTSISSCFYFYFLKFL